MLSSEKKTEIFSQYGKAKEDTGSPESQIALFTQRISDLTGHLKTHRKDFGTQRSLQMLVGKRRRLLNYLMQEDIFRYREIISKLGLRR
ncbi:MAG: 30S ribosomal protein S15 [Bacteroidia bacterium]